MAVAAPPQAVAVPVSMPTGVNVPGSSVKHQVRIRYYRRMKVQGVYRMQVELRAVEPKGASAAGAGDSLVARPLISGAQVQPAEQELGPKASNNTIYFAITPLAKGRLKDARLQLLHQGRVVEEIKTPMTGTSKRTTWLLFGFTLLALAFLVGLLPALPDLTNGKIVESLAVQEKVPSYDEHLPPEQVETFGRMAVALKIQEGYDALAETPNLNFWIFAGLLLLTLLSWFCNRGAWLRKTRKGKPQMLPS
ncbi:MAG: hypothetical protein JNM56_14665, partial [Planctomycetia bacterium]|nr:hypothetical protein [Planctomycetia bacterium]